MNELHWNIEEGKYESSTGSLYDVETANDLVEVGLAVIGDNVQELDFNENN